LKTDVNVFPDGIILRDANGLERLEQEGTAAAAESY
jgi:hypothetical protein